MLRGLIVGEGVWGGRAGGAYLDLLAAAQGALDLGFENFVARDFEGLGDVARLPALLPLLARVSLPDLLAPHFSRFLLPPLLSPAAASL